MSDKNKKSSEEQKKEGSEEKIKDRSLGEKLKVQ